MDIILFSDMVKELILDNDEVSLPGLGAFVSEVVPSVFSDKGYTINPPYRRLSFRQRNGDDSSLAELYSKANGTDIDSSRKILAAFISDLKETLQSKKAVAFPGLGRLRATKENAFFFIPDEDLDIYPYGFGLEPVSLKTHEETPEEVSAVVADLRALVPESTTEETNVAVDPETNILPAPAAEEPAPEAGKHSRATRVSSSSLRWPKPVSSEKPEKTRPKASFWIVLICLAGLAALLFGTFILLCHFAPDFINSLLYTPEELRIINY